MKKSVLFLLGLILLLGLSGCCLSHEWTEASCTAPKTCSKCGETEGEALGHTWVKANCTDPRTCSVCQKTDGEALGHTFGKTVNCTDKKACVICGVKFEADGHSWIEAACDTPKTCSKCGETEGEPLGHDWIPATDNAPKTCSRCGEQTGKTLTEMQEISAAASQYDITFRDIPWYYSETDIREMLSDIFSERKPSTHEWRSGGNVAMLGNELSFYTENVAGYSASARMYFLLDDLDFNSKTGPDRDPDAYNPEASQFLCGEYSLHKSAVSIYEDLQKKLTVKYGSPKEKKEDWHAGDIYVGGQYFHEGATVAITRWVAKDGCGIELSIYESPYYQKTIYIKYTAPRYEQIIDEIIHGASAEKQRIQQEKEAAIEAERAKQTDGL